MSGQGSVRWLGIASVLATAMASVSASGVGATAATRPPHGHYATLRGIRLYYEVYGAGPALVLLHGGAGSGSQFAAQVPFFAHHHRVIVPDMCAQGRTTDRAAPLTYHAMAEDVVALLDHLHVGRADLFGWSDGGVSALDIAMHHPSRVRHIVAFGANYRADGLNAADIAWNDTATAADFGPGMEQFYKRLAPDTAHYRVAMDKVIQLWKTQPQYTLAQLRRIRLPVLIGAGQHDVVRRDHTEAMARAIPHARLWIVPGASHSVVQEQPELVNRTVAEFLRR